MNPIFHVLAKISLKEMMWLGADFQAERKRQISLARKCATSMVQFHKTKETRRLRELVQADFRRRKLAAKIGREVRTWWNKLDKVIAFKQKMQADEERKRAMNRQLVVLVQQTEKYTETLAANTVGDTKTSNDEYEGGSQSTIDEGNGTQLQEFGNETGMVDRRLKGERKRFSKMTIEEALASESRRKSKSRVVDYAKMKLEANEFYGESTASDASESDSSFSLPDENDETDDDSTLRAAMEEEIQERIQLTRRTTLYKQVFSPDPEELRKLSEEQTMDIQQVIQRLQEPSRQEYTKQETYMPPSKRVKFSESVRKPSVLFRRPKKDLGEDADASGVDDNNDRAKDVNWAKAGEVEVDDETTVAHANCLPKEMSYVEEVDHHKKSSMSIKARSRMDANRHAREEGEPPSTSEMEDGTTENDTDDLTDEEEYVAGEPEIDDETTIAQEESMPRDVSYSEELELLKKGAEIPIEELHRMYVDFPTGSVYEEVDNVSSSSADAVVDEEFEDLGVAIVDDETTIEAEEGLKREMTYEEELDVLKRENELSIGELRAMYFGMEDNAPGNADFGVGAEQAQWKPRLRKRGRKMNSLSSEKIGPKWSRGENYVGSDDSDAAPSEFKASVKNAPQTLASRPYLLAPWVKLRMYQQVGLNWLVSLQTRRLNGILADEVSVA
jgi:hypothetical protein